MAPKSLTLAAGVVALAAAICVGASPELSPLVAPARQELQQFGAAYNYDVGYLMKLLEDSPGAFEAFSGAEGMSAYRRALPIDAHYVARVATMRVEDCGPCTELNLKMAVEAGVDRELLETLLHTPEELPDDLRDVWAHARAVVGAGDLDPVRAGRLRQRYGDEGFAELAVVIVGCRVYPTLKRAMLANERCVIGDLEY